MLERQLDLEEKYSRKNIRAHVMQSIDPSHEVFNKMVDKINTYRQGNYYQSKQDRLAKLNMSSEDLAQEILLSILPVKEVSPIQAVATQIAQQLEYEELLDGVKTAAELIAVCEPVGIYTIYHCTAGDNNTGTLAICSHISLEPHIEDLLNQVKYLPPMLLPPIPWNESNANGGYLEGSGSIILGYLNHHLGTQNTEVINILQEIPWQLTEMVDYIEKSKKSLDTPEKERQFNYLVEESLKVYEELMANGNEFYFVWKYDKRGRMYSQGYHVNLQSTEYKKAILEFAEEELIQ